MRRGLIPAVIVVATAVSPALAQDQSALAQEAAGLCGATLAKYWVQRGEDWYGAYKTSGTGNALTFIDVRNVKVNAGGLALSVDDVQNKIDDREVVSWVGQPSRFFTQGKWTPWQWVSRRLVQCNLVHKDGKWDGTYCVESACEPVTKLDNYVLPPADQIPPG